MTDAEAFRTIALYWFRPLPQRTRLRLRKLAGRPPSTVVRILCDCQFGPIPTKP